MRTTPVLTVIIAIAAICGTVDSASAITLRDITLALNPVAYWEFNGDYTDSSGYGNTLTPFGTADLAPGYLGQAANLPDNTNGNGFYVDTPAGSSLNLTGNEWSINLWYNNAKSANTSTGTQNMVNKRGGTTWLGDYWDYGLWMGLNAPGHPQPSNHLVGTMHNGAGSYAYSTSGPLNPTPIPLDEANQWHMATVSWDSGATFFYLDGQLVRTAADGGALTPSTYRMILGNTDSPGTSDAPGNGWQGQLDEVAVFNTAISTEDVASLYGLPAAPPQALSRGHNILLQKGLQLHAIVFPSAPPAEVFNTARWAESNFTTAQVWGYDFDPNLMPPAPGIPWSRSTGVKILDIPSNEVPYESSLVSYQLGDDNNGVTDPEMLAYWKAAYAWFHEQHPNTIMYTNGGGDFAGQLNYMQTTKPDMMMAGLYPFNGSVVGGSPTEMYENQAKYRTLGLIGVDGQPIPVGHYTQTFYGPHTAYHIVSESEIRLQQFAGWAFGFKLVDSFIYDSADGGAAPSIMFFDDSTDTPRPQFYQVAETNRQSLNLGPALVRLITTDVRMKMGRHKDATVNVTNDLPDSVSSWSVGADPYITSITATNLGTKNYGLEGDVIVGYFAPLDGSFTNAGHEDDIYFMIVNGLSDKDGLATDSRQQIHLEFDFGTSGIDSLLRLSRETGYIEEVPLVYTGSSSYYLDLYLDGGTGDLFKFNDGSRFVSITNPGDANGDGMVNEADAAILAENWQTVGGATWTMGDFDNDGNVTDTDATILAANWNAGVPVGEATVPEPAVVMLLGIGLCVLGVRATCCRRHPQQRRHADPASATSPRDLHAAKGSE